ncbi:MAG: ATPase domain-containing protein [Pseudomonadota bacterium]
MSKNTIIRRLKTGVHGLDDLLGGGLPEYSLNIIAGTPGSGKTTLAHQIMFALASVTHRALFFTVLGEPAVKMLRYQQQFAYFDVAKINQSIRFVNLSAEVLDGNLDHVLSRIAEEVKAYAPSLVFIDSFRSTMMADKHSEHWASEQQQFVQRLGMLMASWMATTILVGGYTVPESQSNPIFAIADGIVWLSQSIQRNSMVRKIQVVKMRGQAQAPGLHTFRISNHGIQVFPRALGALASAVASKASLNHGSARALTGVPVLDGMLGGGLPAGYSLLVVGPTGSGKTILATQFLAEGVRLGEQGVIAAFEKSPGQLLGNKKLFSLIQAGQVGVIDTRALDLSICETLHDLIDMIKRRHAKRVVIDSLSGFELALAPEFSEDFRGSLYRMVVELTGLGVTILMTSELEDRYSDLRFSPFGSAFLTDAIVVQRYVEIAGQFKRAIAVVKVRGSAHSKDIRLFDITDEGITIGETLSGYSGIMTGRPTLTHTASETRSTRQIGEESEK